MYMEGIYFPSPIIAPQEAISDSILLPAFILSLSWLMCLLGGATFALAYAYSITAMKRALIHAGKCWTPPESRPSETSLPFAKPAT